MVKAFLVSQGTRLLWIQLSHILFLPQVAKVEVRGGELADKHHIWDLALPDRWQGRGGGGGSLESSLLPSTTNWCTERESTEIYLCLIQSVCTPLFTFQLSLKQSRRRLFEPVRPQKASKPFPQTPPSLSATWPNTQKKLCPDRSATFLPTVHKKKKKKSGVGGGAKLFVKPKPEEPVICDGSAMFLLFFFLK